MLEFNRFFPLLLIFLILIIMAPNFALDNETSDVLNYGNSSDVLSSTNLYINASNENPGDGSIDNPYKNLENVKIGKDTTVHISNGEYGYNSYRSLNNVTIIGESATDTIIKCNHFEITSNNLILKNLTIIGVTFKNQGDFKAENVIFKNSIGQSLDEYDNSYGGSIYTSYRLDDSTKHTISLKDCQFINNTAEYGGAIYFDEGYMEIDNCSFVNNHAFNYGGAIAISNSDKVTIKKSKFINDYSISDAGGAIYVLSSSLTAEDLQIINCTATFGAAITALNVQLDINNLYAFNNHAMYGGGVIYQMYGTSLLTSSNFINNSASNGGALFLDNVTALFLMSNKFADNSAEVCAGAIYSLMNKEYQNTGNTFVNNRALSNDDVYNSSTINPIIQSSEYKIFSHVPDEGLIFPSYYNLVDDGFVTPVKDQKDSGNCWSFAVLAALESCILKSTGEIYDLSEENMKNLMASFSDYGWQIDVNDGGYDDMGIGYLVGWLGPVLESEDPFDDKSALSPLLNSLTHIQNVVYLKRNDYLDNDCIKEAILKYGAVATGIYYSGLYLLDDSYYYYDVIMPSNHAVTIVGWDDTYSRNNFNHIPPGDGAFIVKNSWGEDWGNDGYFYVSYYDTKFAQVGRDEVSYTFILNDTMRYDKNYQYDISGKTDYLITGHDNVWYQNIFTATAEEYLCAVSTYFNYQTNWDVSIYVNGEFKLTKSGKSRPGYYTINLGDLIHLNEGDKFNVVFKIKCDKHANVPILETDYINKQTASFGVSYFSTDGEHWIDLYNYSFSDFNHRYYSQLACIKAFTIFDILNSTIKLDLSDKGIQSANIKAIVCDQYGNPINSGEVIFTIDEIHYCVNVTDGIANLTHKFNDKSLHNVSALFNGENYNPSFNDAEIEFYDSDILFNINDIAYGENLIAQITLVDSKGNLLNDDVVLTINNNDYKIHVNGKTSYKIPVSLDVGTYVANLKYDDEVMKSCFINISRADVSMDVSIDEKTENITINVIFSKLINDLVNISISSKDYLINAIDGKASLFIDDLDYGTYEINVSFLNKNYNPSYKNFTVQTNIYKTKIVPIQVSYTDNAVFCLFNLSKFDNTPLSSEQIVFTLDNHIIDNITDNEGNVGVFLNLINGDYKLVVSFNGHDELGSSILNYQLKVNRTPVVIENTNVPSEINVYEENYANIIFSNNANGILKVVIDEREYLNNQFTLNQWNMSLSNFSVGNHKISIDYTGIEGYTYSKNFDIFVKKVIPKIEVNTSGLYYGKTQNIVFNLPIHATGYLFIDINGKNYYSKINDGKAILEIEGLILGKNSLTYSYDGDKNYLPITNQMSFDVGHMFKLTASDVSMNYCDGSYYNVKISYSNGSIVQKGQISLRIEGKSYKINIQNGFASFKLNLNPKTYKITAEYDGVEVTNKIIVKSILKSNNIKVKKSAKRLVIKASLIKINGKFLKGKKITFNFNGKKYSAKTNNKGIAKLTIKKKILKKLKVNKKYSLKITYLNDVIYKTVRIKNRII